MTDIAPTAPFWRTTPLHKMTPEQWESLCDGCAKCCLVKLIDSETEALSFTNVACHLLDTQSCRCQDYQNRQIRVPDCVRLTPDTLDSLDWMPSTCAYRLVRDGQDLPQWHPHTSAAAQARAARVRPQQLTRPPPHRAPPEAPCAASEVLPENS